MRRNRREELIVAAAQLFAERGYAATSVAEITARADVAHGTFYTYFANRAELLAHTLDEAVRRTQAAAGVWGDEPPVDAAGLAATIETVLARVFALFDAEPWIVRLLVVETFAADGDGARRAIAAVDVLGRPLAQALRAGQTTGAVRADLDVDVAVQVLQAYVVSAAFAGLRGPVSAQRRGAQARALAALATYGVGYAD